MDYSLWHMASGRGLFLVSLDDAEVLEPVCEDIFYGQLIDEHFIERTDQELWRDIEAAYESGNEIQLTRVLSGLRADPVIYNCVIETRNRKWVPQIEQLHDQRSPIFVGVGVAHRVGPDNLLQILKERGFSVRRLGPAPQ